MLTVGEERKITTKPGVRPMSFARRMPAGNAASVAPAPAFPLDNVGCGDSVPARRGHATTATGTGTGTQGKERAADDERAEAGIAEGKPAEVHHRLFEKAGYKIVVWDRSYIPVIDDPEIECLMFRAQEMARYRGARRAGCGLTGKDWILENEADVVEVEDLVYSKNTTQAVPLGAGGARASGIRSVKDLEGKRIATELVQATQRYLAQHGVARRGGVLLGRHGDQGAPAGGRHRRGHGDGLVVARQPSADHRHGGGIHDQAHRQPAGLGRPLEAGARSSCWPCCSRARWRRRQGGAEDERARGRSLDQVSDQLPSLHTPTISSQVDPEWVAIEVIIDKQVAREPDPQIEEGRGGGNRRVSAEQADLLAGR